MDKAHLDFAELNQWYQQPLGQSLAQSITDELAKHLEKTFGYHALQLGLPAIPQWLQQSPISHQIIVDPNHQKPATGLSCQLNALPVADGSLDLVILPHIFSISENPYAVLAEADRTLMPNGCMVIIEFNPWSMWGWRQLLYRFGKRMPWAGHFHSHWKLQRQLTQLGYKIDSIDQVFYRPPCESPKLLDKFMIIETIGKLSWAFPGAVHILIAHKETATITRIKPIWSYKNIVIGKRFIQPTS